MVLLAAQAAPAASQEALPTIEISHKAKPKPRVVARPAVKPQAVASPRPAPAPPPVQVAAESPRELPKQPAQAASEVRLNNAEVNAVPNARPAEALESALPGLNVSQHSGEGKANQYQLRGFQLDHGTDLAITLDGMPLNMRTHGHGQGYADSNFLIPELIGSVLGRKGPYYADEGDFASAGAVHIQYLDKLEKGFIQATGGSFGYARLLSAQSMPLEGGNFLAALESSVYDGPWTRPDEVRKINSVMRWSRGTEADGAAITGMAYANRWYSTDQIPERAVYGGYIPLWGHIDRTDGGDTSRFSLSGRWSEIDGAHSSRVEAYAIRSTLELYNNFTYFLSGHLFGDADLGDQFRQFDRRTIIGLNAQHGLKWDLAQYPAETRVGFQGRFDDIRVGLQDSFQRTPYDSVRNDHVDEGSIGLWTDTSVKWTPWLKTTAGFRVDYFHADVTSLQTLQDAPKIVNSNGDVAPLLTGPFNSGSKGAAITSPKAAIVLGPFYKTEAFLNFGEGFHSTDARGTVINFDTSSLSDGGLTPVDNFAPASRIPLLVKSRGAEIGFRTKAIDNLESSIAFWWLNFDSENQFEGDTGDTTFGRPSRRYGIELNNHYSPLPWIRIDADLALTHARFRGVDQMQALAYADLVTPNSIGYGTFLGNSYGNYIPEAPSVVGMLGIEVGEALGWFGALKYKYKGITPLTEDGYFKGPAVGTLALRVGYRWEGGWKLQADAFNVTNSRSDQITYGYGSLLPTDPLYTLCRNGVAPGNVCSIGVMDRHFHPVEPPAVRVTLSGPLPF